ncbi:hypothetical protein B0T26DRAFT_643157 [Lasiosphaeria miniovina]|uniref:Ankyrin repeat protein n=1 Tax=Lasiosphaeria miniovina TaxID=1954250 RepID=A0AA40E0F9_9PEZI|nr:uncharacterized protein B0T26DRAFT_643157 [Lasiosphaeria miniovina]KAK0722435.1 hypothetical protein B0T26DRAFT_643157 [Lasiosphaeria miniovina]
MRIVNREGEAALLGGYLDAAGLDVKPLHCRRTLDQFSYYMLSSTETRDRTQVAYRWAKKPLSALGFLDVLAKDRPIIMVDQLWLWALHDGTVITSFPNTWQPEEKFNLRNVVVDELRGNKDRPIIKTTEDFIHLILKTSVEFFKRKGPMDCQFHECFQSSINKVAEGQGNLFLEFKQAARKLNLGNLEAKKRTAEIEILFGLDQETELLVEIMDIQDELTIVKTILAQQKDVLEKLLRLYPKKNKDDDEEETRIPPSKGKSELEVLLLALLRDNMGDKVGKREDAMSQDPDDSSGQPKTHQRKVAETKEKEREGGQRPVSGAPKPLSAYTGSILENRELMHETIAVVDNNIRVVADMLLYAEKLDNLLDLKQKHANAWEARFAREGSEETQRHGNIILVFTLVTIIFLPLSFISSFFALDIDVFPKNPEGDTTWPIGEVSGYLCEKNPSKTCRDKKH